LVLENVEVVDGEVGTIIPRYKCPFVDVAVID
jgi:hypothetical protein